MSDLLNKVDSFNSKSDGLRLFCQSWLPENQKAKRIFVFHHGYGEHSGRYKNLIAALDDGGSAFYGMDMRGHGRSDGSRGHCESFDQLADDLYTFSKNVSAQNGGAPLFLFAHSMGAAIALNMLLDAERQKLFKAAAFTAPALKVVMDPVKSAKKFVGTLLAGVVPELTLDAGLNVKYISRDPAEVAAYKADPLVHGKISARMGIEQFANGERVLGQCARITLPIYVAHGTDDGLCDVNGSRQFFKSVGSSDKTYKEYPGLYHELLNELAPDRAQVQADLRAFFAKFA